MNSQCGLSKWYRRNFSVIHEFPVWSLKVISEKFLCYTWIPSVVSQSDIGEISLLYMNSQCSLSKWYRRNISVLPEFPVWSLKVISEKFLCYTWIPSVVSQSDIREISLLYMNSQCGLLKWYRRNFSVLPEFPLWSLKVTSEKFLCYTWIPSVVSQSDIGDISVLYLNSQCGLSKWHRRNFSLIPEFPACSLKVISEKFLCYTWIPSVVSQSNTFVSEKFLCYTWIPSVVSQSDIGEISVLYLNSQCGLSKWYRRNFSVIHEFPVWSLKVISEKFLCYTWIPSVVSQSDIGEISLLYLNSQCGLSKWYRRNFSVIPEFPVWSLKVISEKFLCRTASQFSPLYPHSSLSKSQVMLKSEVRKNNINITREPYNITLTI